MLKIPKGLKKKKKSKKSKRKDQELFTEEELERYKREHQQKETGESVASKSNEEWSKFKDLTTGVDSVLKRTQGDLNRIKSTSFFQRVTTGPREVDSVGREIVRKKEESKQDSKRPPPIVFTKEDLDLKEVEEDTERSDYAATDTSSEEEEQDDIFDTSYVEAVERGEVKLAYVPDSPEECVDDGIFDTSYVDSLIKGQESVKRERNKKTLDIGVAVEVLTGRIDNIAITPKKPTKRIIPGDLIFDNSEELDRIHAVIKVEEPKETSLLDTDSDVIITSPIDLSVSLHTSLINQQKRDLVEKPVEVELNEEDLEFAKLAEENASETIKKVISSELPIEPIILDSWSAFEADNKEGVFAESIVEDDSVEPYLDEVDPFDTSFAERVVPTSSQVDDLDDDNFDPRAAETVTRINNRRKSSVHIHLTDPSGARESITCDDHIDKINKDLLSGSCLDLTELGVSPLNPQEFNESDFIDPFDTTIVDKISGPGKIEIKILEQELNQVFGTVLSSPSDSDFDPRADELKTIIRKPSRPENILAAKSVAFAIENSEEDEVTNPKPVTPFYSRDISIEIVAEEDKEEACDDFEQKIGLSRTLSDQDLKSEALYYYTKKRRHSEYPQPSYQKESKPDLLSTEPSVVYDKVLTPLGVVSEKEVDPFDTEFANEIKISKTELKLIEKEFSLDVEEPSGSKQEDLLEQSDDIFHRKALIPEPAFSVDSNDAEVDPFDTSFADNLQPGKTELKLLETELLN